MEPSALYSQRARYQEQDLSLDFSLGMAHVATQIRSWVLAQAAQPHPPPLDSTLSHEVPSPEPFLYFILGLFSFSSRYLEILAGMQAGPPPSDTEGRESEPDPQPRLAIRDLLS